MKKSIWLTLMVLGIRAGLYCQPSDFGTIYSNNSWSVATDFITNGNATATLSGNYINVTSSTQLNYSNTIYITNYQTKLSQWKFKARFKILSFTNNSYGIGFGLKSTNPNVRNDVFGFIQTSNTGVGGLYILKSDATVFASGPSLGVALNDVIDVDASLNDSVFTLNAVNITSGNTASVSYTYVWDGSPRVIPNTSSFAIYELGGVHQIQSIDISSTEKKGASIVVIGDSKTAGYFAYSFAGRYAAQLNTAYPVTVINAGGADRVMEALSRINELKQLSPSKYLVCIGTNDLRFGSSLMILQANYSNLVSQLEATGAEVYHIQMPEDYTKSNAVMPQNLLLFKNWIQTQYTSKYINGVWDSLTNVDRLKGIYDYSDGVHLNQAGNNKVYEALIASGKLNNAIVLPLKLLDFNAKKLNNNTVELRWIVDNANEAQKFILRRSNDGNHFLPIKEVDAQNKIEFTFIDNSTDQKDRFYQLELKDISGKSTFSKIVFIKAGKNGFANLQTISDNALQFSIHLEYSSMVSVSILDASGRIIKSVSSYLHSGSNSLQIDIRNLKPSTYYLIAELNDRKDAISFIKR
jgi:lysophospholipase L1-like esterase